MQPSNRTLYHGENLEYLLGMDSESVDLIATDPPFNKGRNFKAEDGTRSEGAGFKDKWMWTDISDDVVEHIRIHCPHFLSLVESARVCHSEGMATFLCWMGIRVIEMRRILRNSGSLYLHCDRTASAYIRQMLDAIFGRKNFVAHIIWNYGLSAGSRGGYSKHAPVHSHDTIFAYAKNYGHHTYNIQYFPYDQRYIKEWFRNTEGDGRKYKTRYVNGELTKEYLDEMPGMPLTDTWSDVKYLNASVGWFPSKRRVEQTGYPTQKPLTLYQRIVEIGSNQGDMVLDPFCGSGTTVIAAERAGRQWIGIDLWEADTHKIVWERMEQEGLSTPNQTPALFTVGEVNYQTTPPTRNPQME